MRTTIRLDQALLKEANFRSLLEAVGARGNLIPDAYLGAVAIDHGCEWITTDGDFKRFPSLTSRHLLRD